MGHIYIESGPTPLQIIRNIVYQGSIRDIHAFAKVYLNHADISELWSHLSCGDSQFSKYQSDSQQVDSVLIIMKNLDDIWPSTFSLVLTPW